MTTTTEHDLKVSLGWLQELERDALGARDALEHIIDSGSYDLDTRDTAVQRLDRELAEIQSSIECVRKLLEKVRQR